MPANKATPRRGVPSRAWPVPNKAGACLPRSAFVSFRLKFRTSVTLRGACLSCQSIAWQALPAMAAPDGRR